MFTCDRCKLQLLNANGTINQASVAINAIEFVELSGFSERYDLCDSCTEALESFLGIA